ncbi:alpha/beta fold hydrolase [Streptomyces sp. TLI_171]|uniref:alpha/beta fold hydrolase n=1 Tax=Streptomyces sp. TLI_171 TaxID=1938859 RepID=UPI000C193D27|nr:alpha/beta fold hydrolase [Streptomyces sp. TLI_171]RKE23311.1 putative NADH-flavin reductase [Streptomyces sp. TLI_171]
MHLPRVEHRFVEVDGVRVFYRAAGPETAPVLLLLHGFPSASHQFRRLFDALGSRYRLIAPDYPGFGHTEVPESFVFSFDALAEVVEGFVLALGLERFALFAFDFGGPVGFRLAARRPERITGLIVQNANAYTEGLSEPALGAIAHRTGEPGAAEAVQPLFTLEVTRGQYEGGATDPSLISPDGWTLDQHFLDLPGRRAAQTALALDYHSNVERYPVWQRWLREHRPPTLVLWGRNDAFFLPAGAEAFRRDVPGAEVHLLDTGHFALEECLPEIAPLIEAFLDRLPAPRPLRIAVLGASGNLGGELAREAVRRGHQVTPLGRADADAADAAALASVLAGHDAVVAALKGPDRLVPRAAEALLAALPEAGVARLLFVGGGGSLEYAPGRRFVDSPGFPAQYVETARDQAAALDVLRAADTPVEWTYLSPPPVRLEPGPRTGRYRVAATDAPLTDAAGTSRITTGDFASAALDALEQRTFPRTRITAATP